MPSAIVHLKTAFDLKEQLSIQNLGQFYVGSVSPDAVNIDGFAPQEVRYPAHLRSLDYDEWKQNVTDYISAHRHEYAADTDFFKGFVLHILTDICWDELAQPVMFEGFKQKGLFEELRHNKWEELYRFNSLLAGPWLYDDVLPKMAAEEHFRAVSTVTPEQLRRHIGELIKSRIAETIIDEKPLVLDLNVLPPVEEACLKKMKEYSFNEQ